MLETISRIPVYYLPRTSVLLWWLLIGLVGCEKTSYIFDKYLHWQEKRQRRVKSCGQFCLFYSKGNCLKVLFPSNIKTSTRTVGLLGKGRCMTADMIIKVFLSLLHTRRFEELLLRLWSHWTASGVARCPLLQGPALETSAGMRSTSSPREEQRWAGIRNTTVRSATKPLLSQLAAC